MALPAVHKCLQGPSSRVRQLAVSRGRSSLCGPSIGREHRSYRAACRSGQYRDLRGGRRWSDTRDCVLLGEARQKCGREILLMWLSALLSDENEQLVKKLKKLHIKNKELEKNLGQIQEKLYLQQLMRDYGTSRDVQVQTEAHLWHKGGYSKDLILDGNSDRLLEMYNELQKSYVKEIKTNQEQREAIKNLTDFFEEIEDLKHAVQESVKLNNQYEKCLKQISVMYGLPFTTSL